MSAKNPLKSLENLMVVPAFDPPSPEPGRVAELEAEVHLEYARYLEKRDSLRKANGRLRRSLIHAQLAS